MKQSNQSIYSVNVTNAEKNPHFAFSKGMPHFPWIHLNAYNLLSEDERILPEEKG